MFSNPFSRRSPRPAGPFAQMNGSNPKPAVLVTLLCASSERAAEALRRHGKARSHHAIFVVTDADTRIFHTARAVFEHLPAPEMVRSFAAQGDWAAYLEEHWRMLHLKWNPLWLASYGVGFNNYLENCRIAVD